jgi:hypothetical protein
MTCRHSILKSLNKWGIQGHMFYFIRNFLTDRGFRVQANGVLSKQRELQNGCPQGSVLSPSLFLIALNDIGQHISYPLCHAIYADDLIIYTTGKHIDLLEREVQPPAKESSLPRCKGIITCHKLVNLACNYLGQFRIRGLFHKFLVIT